MNTKSHSLGDLVHIDADNIYFGLGVVIEVENDHVGTAYRVLTPEGYRYYFMPFELSPVDETG